MCQLPVGINTCVHVMGLLRSGRPRYESCIRAEVMWLIAIAPMEHLSMIARGALGPDPIGVLSSALCAMCAGRLPRICCLGGSADQQTDSSKGQQRSEWFSRRDIRSGVCGFCRAEQRAAL